MTVCLMTVCLMNVTGTIFCAYLAGGDFLLGKTDLGCAVAGFALLQAAMFHVNFSRLQNKPKSN